MMTTLRQVALSTSLLLGLLTACGRDAGGSNADSSRGDAGAAPDGSTPLAPNRIEDAANSGERADAAVSGDGGSAGDGRNDAGSEPSAGGAGGRAPENMAGSGGSARAGEDAPPPAASDAGSQPGPDPDTDSGPVLPEGICTSCGDCEEAIKVVSTMHTDMTVRYADPPPTSGPHNPCWTHWGVHDTPARAERWVHNLEHGGVVFLYHCPDGCDADIENLKRLSSSRVLTIVTEYEDLPTRFGLVSWGNRLITDCYDGQAFVDFYNRHVNKAPESNFNPPNPGCPP